MLQYIFRCEIAPSASITQLSVHRAARGIRADSLRARLYAAVLCAGVRTLRDNGAAFYEEGHVNVTYYIATCCKCLGLYKLLRVYVLCFMAATWLKHNTALVAIEMFRTARFLGLCVRNILNI